tara:strand:+ start:545 stop:1120 length:576 start_codon:yes stop_codon:yes gene_type:complete
MAHALPPKLRDKEVGVMAPTEISKDICQKIIELHKDSRNVSVQGKIQQDNSNIVNVNVRQTEVFIIHECHEWVDELILNCAKLANDQFDFAVTGLFERPQLLKYSAPSNGYDWHLDIGMGDSSTRKISISILLNDDYEGGELAFFTDGETDIKPDCGTAVAFPSYLSHRVLPITRGIRWSLVCWVAGDPFR